MVNPINAPAERARRLAPQTTQDQRHEFAGRLAAMQAEALRLGLPITARALHNGAVRAIGWEMAGNFEKAASYVAGDQP